MGVYLSTPHTEVETQTGEHLGLSYGAGEMQGWRKTMEDAHICDPEAGIFAVFDGHGGKAVAKFAKIRFVKEFTSLPAYHEGNYGLALRKAFHRIDELLEDPKHDALLKRFQSIPNPSERTAEHGQLDDDDYEVSEGAVQDEQAMDLDSDNDTTGEGKAKKKLTTAQAVQFFHQLLLSERRNRGDGSAPSSSAVKALPSPSPSSSSSSFVASTGTHSPASIYTDSGPVCNLSDHRVVSGCTAVVAFRKGNQLYVANAGDSRCCLCRADGTALPLSEDHKPMAEGERSRIEAAGGFVNQVGRVNGNLNLSRSLGDLKYKQVKQGRDGQPVGREGQMITAEPDLTVTTLQPGDQFFVMACDGVWDIMSCQEICDFVRERLARGLDTVQIIKEIFAHCIAPDVKMTQGLGGDNMSAVLVLLK